VLCHYQARVVTRVRSVEGELSEVQILEFPSQDVLSAFMRDRPRDALADLRARAVDRTEVVRVRIVT
jgi:uncharacterized protein (DUF1330 family)